MSRHAQAFLASVVAAAIATGHAAHASSFTAALGWSLAAWFCLAAAILAAWVRGTQL